MLHIDQSKLFRTNQRKLASDAFIASEGKAAVAVYENGELCVKPSTGASGEKFAGVMFSSKTPLTSLPLVEVLVAAASKVTLTNDPIPGTLRIVVGGTEFEAGDPATAGKYSISGRVITLPAAQATATASVTYSYSPSVNVARAMQGDVEPGFALSSVMRQTGVIEGGEVVTSEFDTAADWSDTSLAVRLGADGKFTTEGTGTVVPCIVTRYPVAGVPRLGLSFNI